MKNNKKLNISTEVFYINQNNVIIGSNSLKLSTENMKSLENIIIQKYIIYINDNYKS